MNRLLGAIVLLCAQVFAVFGTGNLVVCNPANGESAVEFAGSECCRAARAAEDRTRSARDAATGAVATSDADPCRDVPWTQARTIVAHGTQIRSEASRAVRAEPVAARGDRRPGIAERASQAASERIP